MARIAPPVADTPVAGRQPPGRSDAAWRRWPLYLASEGSGDVNGQLFGVRAGEVYLYTYPGIDRQILSYGRRFTMDELDEQAPRALAFGSSSPLRG